MLTTLALAVATALSIASLHRRLAMPAVALLVPLVAALVVFRDLGSDEIGRPEICLAAIVAVLGGISVVSSALRLASPGHSTELAPSALPGGRWIGALERLMIFGALGLGLVSAVALVIAVKALGRYPELRSGDHADTAERFIIGTFMSAVWAAACSYVAFGAPVP